MGGRYTDGKVPAASVDEAPEQELRQLWESTKVELLPLFDGFQFHKALERIFTFISGINKYAETRAPWKLAKSDDPQTANWKPRLRPWLRPAFGSRHADSGHAGDFG